MRAVPFCLWFYKRLLRLYPCDLRREFESEMIETFRQLLPEASQRGPLPLLSMCLRETRDALREASKSRWKGEHHQVDTSSPVTRFVVNLRRTGVVVSVVAVSILGRALLEPRVGPLSSLAAILLIPLVLTAVLGRWWAVLLAPFIFWIAAYFVLWRNQLLIGTASLSVHALEFTVAALVVGAFGVRLKRLKQGAHAT